MARGAKGWAAAVVSLALLTAGIGAVSARYAERVTPDPPASARWFSDEVRWSVHRTPGEGGGAGPVDWIDSQAPARGVEFAGALPTELANAVRAEVAGSPNAVAWTNVHAVQAVDGQHFSLPEVFVAGPTGITQPIGAGTLPLPLVEPERRAAHPQPEGRDGCREHRCRRPRHPVGEHPRTALPAANHGQRPSRTKDAVATAVWAAEDSARDGNGTAATSRVATPPPARTRRPVRWADPRAQAVTTWASPVTTSAAVMTQRCGVAEAARALMVSDRASNPPGLQRGGPRPSAYHRHDGDRRTEHGGPGPPPACGHASTLCRQAECDACHTDS